MNEHRLSAWYGSHLYCDVLHILPGCPKFDDAAAYVEKIKTIPESVNVRSITVVYMEVPCCGGFVQIVREALEKSGVDIPLKTVQIGIRGGVIKRKKEEPAE